MPMAYAELIGQLLTRNPPSSKKNPMKIAPILAALVVLFSLAYAEKTPPQPREKKARPRIDRSKQPARSPVAPKPKPATPPARTPNPKPAAGGTDAARSRVDGTPTTSYNLPEKGDEVLLTVKKPLNNGMPVSGTEAARVANPNRMPSAQGGQGEEKKPSSWSDDWADEGISGVRAGANAGSTNATPEAAAQRTTGRQNTQMAPNSGQPRSLTDDFGGVPLATQPAPTRISGDGVDADDIPRVNSGGRSGDRRSSQTNDARRAGDPQPLTASPLPVKTPPPAPGATPADAGRNDFRTEDATPFSSSPQASKTSNPPSAVKWEGPDFDAAKSPGDARQLSTDADGKFGPKTERTAKSPGASKSSLGASPMSPSTPSTPSTTNQKTVQKPADKKPDLNSNLKSETEVTDYVATKAEAPATQPVKK